MRIALAGLGNVGAAVLRLLRGNADLLASRAGQAITVVAVSARDKGKNRACDLSGIEWVDAPLALAARKDVDVVVEAIGGASGVAHALAAAALANGKHVVTANKALIAAHGVELAVAAERAGVRLSFEASVCGAVPVMKTLREGLSANRVSTLRGILNGTCNYILTRMEQAGVDFNTALVEAQQRGYAEAFRRYRRHRYGQQAGDFVGGGFRARAGFGRDFCRRYPHYHPGRFTKCRCARRAHQIAGYCRTNGIRHRSARPAGFCAVG
jgi:homoserine dehydrogenase